MNCLTFSWIISQNLGSKKETVSVPSYTPFFYKQSIFDPRPEIV